MKRILTILLLLLPAVAAHGQTWTVGPVTSTSTPSAQHSLTTGSVDTRSYNLLVVEAAWDNTGATAAVSDSASNACWTSISGPTISGGLASQWWYCLSPTTSQTHTFTVTLNGSNTSYIDMIVFQANSGAGTTPAIDAIAANAAGNSSTPASNPLTTAGTNDLLLAYETHYDSETISAGLVAGSTGTIPAGGATNYEAFEYRIVSATVSDATAAFSLSGASVWISGFAAFKAVASSATEQEGYRWRNDDGSETTATWAASQDTALTGSLSTNYRLRAIVNTAGDVASAQYQLEYKKSTDGTWTTVGNGQSVANITLRAVGTKVNGTTSLALSQPTGTTAGDALVAFILDHATSGTTTAPTGWTRQGGVAGTAGRFQVYTAVVGQNGLTGTSWTWSGLTTRAEGVIAGYYNVDTTTPVDVAASARLNASGTTGTASITPGTAQTMIVAGYAALASGSTWSAEAVASNPGSLAEQYDGANSTYCSLAIAHNRQTGATAVATGDSSATMGTSGNNAGIMLALRPVITTLPIKLATSANIAAGGTTATTAQLTPPASKTTSNFTAGKIGDDANPLPAVDVASDYYTELEWSLQAVSPAAAGDTYQFRITAAGTPLTTYSLTPQLTIAGATGVRKRVIVVQ